MLLQKIFCNFNIIQLYFKQEINIVLSLFLQKMKDKKDFYVIFLKYVPADVIKQHDEITGFDGLR